MKSQRGRENSSVLLAKILSIKLNNDPHSEIKLVKNLHAGLLYHEKRIRDFVTKVHMET